MAHLDRERYASSDPFEGPAICFARTVQTGKRGRPRVEVDPSLLSTALGLRPKTQIAETAKCSARTIRRRQLDHGINVPGPSPSVGNGSIPQVAVISDEELDRYLVIIMQDFPSFGRRLATACLKANGVKVSERRVREALVRVNGVPGIFGGRRVHRRQYWVAGANSLWHHDGQHGIPISCCFLKYKAYPQSQA
jgi:hypothetical protein